MRTLKCLLLSGLCLLAVNASAVLVPCGGVSLDYCADGSINVGTAKLFTALSAGDTSLKDNTVTGPSLIRGNIGVGGSANFSISDGTLDGDVYMNSNGKFTMSGGNHFTGGHTVLYHQDTIVNGAMSDAYNLSALAAMDSTTTGSFSSFSGNTINTNKNFTITGSGHIVLNLKDLVMTNGTFTLASTNPQTSFIINVQRNFSLTGNAQIKLDGVLPSHVLFNVIGSGSQVSLNQGTSLTGILLAANRKVDLSGGKVFGKVIGSQINVTSGGQIVSQ